MDVSIKPRVCVIGAGTMGIGITAHLVNSGFHVTLLDLNKHQVEKSLHNALKTKPPHFYSKILIHRVMVDELDHHLDQIKNYEWICEAIVEKYSAKASLYKKIEPFLNSQAILTTNTSGLEISSLAKERSEAFQKRFLGAHFFNPPRYLKLVELIPTQKTDPLVVQNMVRVLEDLAGKRVVFAKDTPGFIANRYGLWVLLKGIHLAEKYALTLQEVDSLCGPYLERPKTGIFRLADLIGLDIVKDIASNTYERCPHDPDRENLLLPRSLKYLIDQGFLGNKSGKGYYFKKEDEFYSLNLQTLEYEASLPSNIDFTQKNNALPLFQKIQVGFDNNQAAGKFFKEFLGGTLQYAISVADEVSYTVQDFDRIMQWGFGWHQGPFELIDQIGALDLGLKSGTFYQNNQTRNDQGSFVPLKNEDAYKSIADYELLKDFKDIQIRDLGDGAKAAVLTSKMGILNPEMVDKLLQLLNEDESPLVLCSLAKSFSAGFNLRFFLEKSKNKEYNEIEKALQKLQKLSCILSERNSVAALHGYTLGGGFEIAVGCRAVVAHPESQIGLPEILAGLLPAGGGTARMRLAHQDNPQELKKILSSIAQGKVCTNAFEAAEEGYLNINNLKCKNSFTQHSILLHPDKLISESKRLAMASLPPHTLAWKLISSKVQQQLKESLDHLLTHHAINTYNLHIANMILDIFCSTTSIEDAFDKERYSFIQLLESKKTLARIEHLIRTNKPLRDHS